MTEQNQLKRIHMINNMEDKRIHLMLYFFDGHHVKASDFIMIKRFQKYVNIIPVIAKADSYTEEELKTFKLDILCTAAERGVKFFDCGEAIKLILGEVSFIFY